MGRLVYLVDTNIFVEIFLKQARKEEAKQFLNAVAPDSLFFTEFSLYSIGIILFREKLFDDYVRFLNDVILEGSIFLIRLNSEEMTELTTTSQRFELDFDDTYQYVAAEKYNLQIVSFDKDFDKTERGRKTPAQVLEGLQSK